MNKTKTKTNPKLEKSIHEKLELSLDESIIKMRLVLTDSEIVTELIPHLTTEEINYLKTKL